MIPVVGGRGFRASARLGLVVNAIQPDGVASHEEACKGSDQQQSADKENQERSDHRSSVHATTDRVVLIYRMSQFGQYQFISQMCGGR